MKVGLHDCERKNGFPNLALMKLSAFHKKSGDMVEWCQANTSYDLIYSAKVFTYTNGLLSVESFENFIKGGTGYFSSIVLSDDVEHICPDYDLYGKDYSVGFLTRGCINKCDFCVVPQKEGKIRANADFSEFVKHKNVVFLDNNVLAHKHGIEQIEKLSQTNLKVDFNQGLDARLINDGIARRLSKLKWLRSVRLACDSQESKPHVQRAVANLRWHNTTPRLYFVYLLVGDDIEDALDRIKFLKGLDVYVFAQVLVPLDAKEIKYTDQQRHLMRWVNRPQIFRSCSWEEYKRKEAD